MNSRHLYLAALVILAGCAPAPAEELEANKDLVRQFVATINAADWDAFDTLLTEDFRRHSQATTATPVLSSREDFKRLQEAYLLTFPDQHVTIRMLVAEGDMVAAYTTYAGTNTGPMGEVPATGRAAELVNIGIFRIDQDRIAELWVEWDNLAMLSQLGLFPPAGPPGRS